MPFPVSTLPMPNAAEEVTLEWVRSIFGNEHISAFEITAKRLHETTGKLYLTLSYTDEAEATAKGWPKYVMLKGAFNPEMFALPGYKTLLMHPYTTEVNFFTYLGSQLPADSKLRVTKTYWAGATADQAILAMEDLNHDGYVFGDCTKNHGLEPVRSGLDQLATLHAATWGWKGSDPEHAWLEPNVYTIGVRRFFAGWDAVVNGDDRPPLPPIIKDDAARMIAASEKYFVTHNPRFLCAVHGDAHAGNTFREANNQNNTYFLDWQLVSESSCFHDVGYFITGMLSVADRREHEMELLDYYLAALARNGGPTFSRTDPDVIKEYSRVQFSGIAWILTPYVMQKKERVMAMVERYAAAMVDHKTVEMLTEGWGEKKAAVAAEK